MKTHGDRRDGAEWKEDGCAELNCSPTPSPQLNERLSSWQGLTHKSYCKTFCQSLEQTAAKRCESVVDSMPAWELGTILPECSEDTSSWRLPFWVLQGKFAGNDNCGLGIVGSHHCAPVPTLLLGEHLSSELGSSSSHPWFTLSPGPLPIFPVSSVTRPGTSLPQVPLHMPTPKKAENPGERKKSLNLGDLFPSYRGRGR